MGELDLMSFTRKAGAVSPGIEYRREYSYPMLHLMNMCNQDSIFIQVEFQEVNNFLSLESKSKKSVSSGLVVSSRL